MDPIIPNIQLKDSFSTKRSPEVLNKDNLIYFSISSEEANQIELKLNLFKNNTNYTDIRDHKLVNCNEEQYKDLINLKNQFKNPNFSTARIKCNPYEKLGKSIFGNRAAVKLANIDSLYNLTGAFNEFFSDDPDYRFCDIASAPGSWSEYLQFRRPLSFGYAISLRSSEKCLNFDTSRLDMRNMNIIYGPKDTDSGDLYVHHQYFSNLVRRENDSGVDLVMGDGGIEVENKEELQELLSSRLILTELLVSLKCLKEDGKMLLKIFDSVLQITQNIIYIAALCFERISIIKPISSRPANSEMYLIGEGYRSINGVKYIQLLEIVITEYGKLDKDIMFSHLFGINDKNFNAFMTEINNFSIQNQIEYSKGIIDYMIGKMIVIPELNLHMAFLLWKIPGNVNDKDKTKKYIKKEIVPSANPKRNIAKTSPRQMPSSLPKLQF